MPCSENSACMVRPVRPRRMVGLPRSRCPVLLGPLAAAVIPVLARSHRWCQSYPAGTEWTIYTNLARPAKSALTGWNAHRVTAVRAQVASRHRAKGDRFCTPAPAAECPAAMGVGARRPLGRRRLLRSGAGRRRPRVRYFGPAAVQIRSPRRRPYSWRSLVGGRPVRGRHRLSVPQPARRLLCGEAGLGRRRVTHRWNHRSSPTLHSSA